MLRSQKLCGKHRVEDALGGVLVGLPEQAQVIVCTVENDGLHRLRGKQGRNVDSAERVHDIVVFADGNLDEAEPCMVMVHGIGLGIDGRHIVEFEVRNKVCKTFFVIYKYVFFVLHHFL